MANKCKDKYKFTTSEAASKAALRTQGIIDEFLVIKKLNEFRKTVTEWSAAAKERWGIKDRLFTEKPFGNKIQAVPNKEAFKKIDNAKGIYYQVIENEFDEQYWRDLYLNNKTEGYYDFEGINIPGIENKFKPDFNNVYHGTNKIEVDNNGNLILKPSLNFEKVNSVSFTQIPIVAQDYMLRKNGNLIIKINNDALPKNFSVESAEEIAINTDKSVIIPKGSYSVITLPTMGDIKRSEYKAEVDSLTKETLSTIKNNKDIIPTLITLANQLSSVDEYSELKEEFRWDYEAPKWYVPTEYLKGRSAREVFNTIIKDLSKEDLARLYANYVEDYIESFGREPEDELGNRVYGTGSVFNNPTIFNIDEDLYNKFFTEERYERALNFYNSPKQVEVRKELLKQLKLKQNSVKDSWDENTFNSNELPFQLKGTETQPASPEILSKVKEAAKKMGISIQDLADYARKNPSINVSGVNGLADIVHKIVAIAEGKEDVAITEEVVHIALEMLEQTNPKLVTEMISHIGKYKVYKNTYEAYKNTYKLSDGKPDIRKIKKEAVGKLITELIVNDNKGEEYFPELADEETRSLVRLMWQKALDWIRSLYKEAGIDFFREAKEQILSGELKQQIKEGVDFVFEQNPELANAVYEALGFKTENYTGIGTEDLDNLIDDSLNVNWNLLDSLQEELFSKEAKWTLKNRPEKHTGEKFTWEHIQNVVESAKKIPIPSNVDRKTLILAALLHDIGKPYRNEDHALDSVKVINRLFKDNKYSKLVKLAVRHHMISTSTTQEEYKKIVQDAQRNGIKSEDFIELLLALNIADITRNRAENVIDNYSGKSVKDTLLEEIPFKRKQLETISQQQKQQALQLYSQYLSTIFPDSKVKDIVYHGSLNKIETFDKNKLGSFTKAASAREAIFFTDNIEVAKTYAVPKNLDETEKGRELLKEFDITKITPEEEAQYGLISMYKKQISNFEDDFDFDSVSFKRGLNKIKGWKTGTEYEYYSEIYPSVLNIKNPKVKDFESKSYREESYFEIQIKAKENNNDGTILKNTFDGRERWGILESNIYTIFEPEQIHILGSKQDIERFKEFVNRGDVYLQLSNKQKDIQQKLLQTGSIIKKVEGKQETDTPISDEETNWYEVLVNGQWEKVKKRVTDRVKEWYRRTFGSKEFTAKEIEINEIKRNFGIKGHRYFEEIAGRFYNKDGTKREKVESRPNNFSSDVDRQTYLKVENYFIELMQRFTKDGKNPLVFSEVVIYDEVEKEAGTIDLLIVEEDGKGHIFDYKFLAVGKDANDLPWFKQKGYDVQLSRYKNILANRYGMNVGMQRAIPILMKLDKQAKDKPLYVSGISIGSADPTKIEDYTLLPYSAKGESMTVNAESEEELKWYKKFDELIGKLNAVLDKIGQGKASSDEERQFKAERLNVLSHAIRVAQTALHLNPLIDSIKEMRKEGDLIIDDYNTKYKSLDYKTADIGNKEISDFAMRMQDFQDMADIFANIVPAIKGILLPEGLEKTDPEYAKFIKEQISDLYEEQGSIKTLSEDVKTVSREFADRFIGMRNLIKGLLDPSVIIKGMSALFSGISTFNDAAMQLLYKLTSDAIGMASRVANDRVQKIIDIQEKLKARGGDLRPLVQKIYQKDKEGSIVNKLIYKYQRKFYDEFKDNSIQGHRSMDWIKENIDIDEYKKEADEHLTATIKRLETKHKDDEFNRERLIEEAKRKWDISHPHFDGWNNYILARHPKDKWLSDEYKDVASDSDLLALYNFIVEINQEAKGAGYIENKVASTFLPFVKKGFAESFAWGIDSPSVIRSVMDKFTIDASTVGYGKVDEITGLVEHSIPKYFTHDFTDKGNGEYDYSQVSEDIFKNMIAYITHLEKYKYLSEIEGQVKAVRTIQATKGHIEKNNLNKVIMENGKVKDPIPENIKMTEMFDSFTRALLYGEKYATSDGDIAVGMGPVKYIKKVVNKVAGREVYPADDTSSAVSLMKTVDAMNRGFQLKTLGFEFISGAVNAFGGDIQVTTQAGHYFTAGEYFVNKLTLMRNLFNKEEGDMFMKLMDKFLPLKDDPSYERIKQAGMSNLTKGSFSDTLMFFMRFPEQVLEKSVFMSLLQNMMVSNGKVVSIREVVREKYNEDIKAGRYSSIKRNMESEIEELKKSSSLWATKKIENGELVIPGMDLNDYQSLQRITRLTRRISRNATGGMSDNDRTASSMNIWLNSMMVFKNWIPKLVETRFKYFQPTGDDFSIEINENDEITGEKYDIGRVRLFWNFMHWNILKSIKDINDTLSVNEQGLLRIDELYEKYTTQYFERTGKIANISKEDFIELVSTNLRNQVRELTMLMSLFGAGMAMGFMEPPDDADKATKNFYRWSQKVVDRFTQELMFFYNPLEFQKLLSGSMFPAVGLLNDVEKFSVHFFRQTTGIKFSDLSLSPEEVREEAYPLKYLMRMAPVTKPLVTYGAILSDDFAKEFDVTVQKESSIR